MEERIPQPELCIGDVITIGRTEYTIVGEFCDKGREYYVGRYEHALGYYVYSNILAWNSKEGHWFKIF